MTERDHEREQQPSPRIRVTDRRRTVQHVQPDAVDEAAAVDDSASAPPVIDPDSAQPVRGVAEPDAGDAAALAAARQQASEYLEQLQRVTADFDNARKRMVKDQTRAVEMASERLVMQLLDVLDEFQIAMAHSGQAPEEFAPYLKGFELVFAKLFDTLRAEGLERIDAVGQAFDPTRHEALMQTGEGDGHPVVAEVFRDGYTFKGKVLRPAGVRVQRQEE